MDAIQLIAVVALGAVLAWYLYAWSAVGRDRIGTGGPRRDRPPEGFSAPGLMLALGLKNSIEVVAIALVNLAAKGHLHLTENAPGHFSISRRMSDDRLLFPIESDILNALLPQPNAKLVLASPDARARIARTRQITGMHLETAIRNEMIRANTTHTAIGLLLSVMALSAITLAAPDPAAAGLAFLMTLFGAGLIEAAQLDNRVPLRPGLIAGSAVAAGGILAYGLSADVLTATMVAALCGVNGWFSHLVKAPTPERLRIEREAFGFATFVREHRPDLDGATAEQTEGLFSAFLPFTMALGLASEWNAKFRDPEIKLADPVWYQGQRRAGMEQAGGFGMAFQTALCRNLEAA